MKKGLFAGMVGLSLMFVFYSPAIAGDESVENGRSYPDGHGGKVYFSLGDISFADEVVSYQIGDPAPSRQSDGIPEEALGIPDYIDSVDDNYTCLGCGGILTLRFDDNVLTDNEGPDLYVFEIGDAVEPTSLSISRDGTNWIFVGKISGGKAEVDISDYVKPGEIFYYIRLEDLRTACGEGTPGADIDAVGAIGSAIRISLKGSVLFEFDKWNLSDTASSELQKIAERLKSYRDARISIDGHTDSVGSSQYNINLSYRRASSVRDYLSGLEEFDGLDFQVNGYGKSRPIATNKTEEGRQSNRRVEIIVFPKQSERLNGKSGGKDLKTLDVSGLWQTSWGKMSLTQSGEKVEGHYDEDNGEIFGVLKDNVLDGYWIEDSSSERCTEPLRGRYHWGHMRMTFGDPDGFSAVWGYCDGELTRKDWNGSRSLSGI